MASPVFTSNPGENQVVQMSVMRHPPRDRPNVACGGRTPPLGSATKIELIMKILTALLCAAILAGLTTSAVAAEKIQHIVSLKFKSTASAEDIKKVETAFADLKTKISQIKALEWGTNISPEKLNKGFTHCWILTFNSAEDRDAYLVHPDHKAFGKSLGPVLEDVFVIDIVAKQ